MNHIGIAQELASRKWKDYTEFDISGNQNEDKLIANELANCIFIKKTNGSHYYYSGNLNELSEIEKDEIKEIKISGKEESISNNLFEGCTNLERVEFQEYSKLKSIGSEAFKNCTSLNYFEMPKDLKTIESNSFENCGTTLDLNLSIKGSTFLNLNMVNLGTRDSYTHAYSNVSLADINSNDENLRNIAYYLNNQTISNYLKWGGKFIVSFKSIFTIIFDETNILVSDTNYYHNYTWSSFNSNDKFYIKRAFDKWDMVIEGIYNKNNDNYKIQVSVSAFIDIPSNPNEGYVLGGAYLENIYVPSLENNVLREGYYVSNYIDEYIYGYNLLPKKGFFQLNLYNQFADKRLYSSSTYSNSLNSGITRMRYDRYASGFNKLYYVTLHEIGHILGIGPLWWDQRNNGTGKNFLANNSPIEIYNGGTESYYKGIYALKEYRRYHSSKDLIGIPIEDDGGGGTEGVHPEEGNNNRYINGSYHEGLDIELMSGWIDSQLRTVSIPLSRISIGFLEDLGFKVNYNESETYNNI
tara:strand:+ start:290 stop:1864 length:1575 start_codon:yes stop_codon:yes gene_type:complete